MVSYPLTPVDAMTQKATAESYEELEVKLECWLLLPSPSQGISTHTLSGTILAGIIQNTL